MRRFMTRSSAVWILAAAVVAAVAVAFDLDLSRGSSGWLLFVAAGVVLALGIGALGRRTSRFGERGRDRNG